MFADDVVLCPREKDVLQLEREQWREASEKNGMKVSRANTEYSSTCHERTPSGPGKSVRTLQVAARHRDGWTGGGRQL